MILRLILIVLVVLGAIYLVRRVAPHVTGDPQRRAFLAGLSRNVLFIYLFRRAIPFLLRALRTLHLFR